MTAILLAAGSSKRFGSQKLLARLADGRYVVEAAAHNLLAAAGRVIAVTGSDEQLMRVLDDCGCQVAVNADAAQGMGTSIAAGVRAGIDAQSDADINAIGWLIALGDMPYIQPETIARIRGALNDNNGIVIPTFDGLRGHPVAFAGRFGMELTALQGDSGARQVLALHPDRIKLMAVDDAGVLADIDTPDDLERAFPHCRP